MHFAAGQLERLQDRYHLFDAGNGGQRFDLEFVLIADDADDGALFTATEMRFEPQFLDVLQDVVDLLLGGAGTQSIIIALIPLNRPV